MVKVPKIKIYLDSASLDDLTKYKSNKFIKGFTTNPSLMKNAGIKNYKNFIKETVKKINKPVSFEIFSDEKKEIVKQARIISSFGKNIFVKIPIVNSRGQNLSDVIKALSEEGIKINITAVFSPTQLVALKKIDQKKCDEIIISIFAGRIMDTGVFPDLITKKIKRQFRFNKKVKILWASTREIYNLFQAHKLGYNIITVSPDIFKKLNLIGYELNKYSKETSKQFILDSKKSKLSL